MLVKPLGFEERGLPKGLMHTTIKGHLAVLVINVGSTNVMLKAYMRLASLHSGEDILVFEWVGPQQEQQVAARVREVTSEIANLCFLGLFESQAEQVRQLLCKYSHVFAFSDLGCTNLIQHEILVIDDAPLCERYLRIPPSQYEEMKNHIKNLLEQGVIRGNSSSYSSPLVIVQKKDGSIWLCVDYK